MPKSKKVNFGKTKVFKEIKKCCDPYNIHKRKICTDNLRTIREGLIERVKFLNITLFEGNLICMSCLTKINRNTVNPVTSVNPAALKSFLINSAALSQSDPIASTSGTQAQQPMDVSDDSDIEQHSFQKSSSSSTDDVDTDVKGVIDKLNKAFIDSPITRIDYKRVYNSKKYATNMLRSITKFLASKIFQVPNPTHDFDEMISQLKDKLGTASNRNEKIKILSVLPESWTANTIAEEFQVSWHMAKQTKILVEKYGIFCGTERKLGSRRLDETTFDLVQNFYLSDEISRNCPGLRDYVIVNEKNGKTTKQRRLVLMNLKEAYVLFKEQHTNIKIGFSKFAELRPRQCVLALENYGTHTTCVCQYHQNFKLCFSALKQTGIHRAFETFRNLLNAVVCGKNLDSCHFGSCIDCFELIVNAAIKVRNILEDEMLLEVISFKQWTNAPGQYSLETITKTTDEFVEFYEIQIKNLLAHDFIAQKQSKFFKNRKENLADKEMLVICDFSENYTFTIQDEIQAFHWVNKQCTIHPFALYWKENGVDKRKSIVVIAESLKHDVTAVYLFQKKLIEFIKQKLEIEKIIFCSDGAGGQYKNRKNFFNISQFKVKYDIEAEWHCFATSHGKSACDGIGGTFKRNARRYNLQNPSNPILTAKELYEWAIKQQSLMEFMYCSEEDYVSTSLELVGLYEKVKPIDGTQGFHSFKPVSNGRLEVKKYSESENSKIVNLLR